jgi:hypothetical protein
MQGKKTLIQTVTVPVRRTRKSYTIPAVVLLFLAPLFGEYLLGNLTIFEIVYLPFLVPLYGAGALLIRETAHRAGRGSATMLILGVAYALFEEGLVDQMLFNRFYFTGQEQISATYIPILGIDAWLSLIVLAMHAIWSTYIPITLVEYLFPDWGTRPWLSAKGLGLVLIIFILGSSYLCYTIYLEENFFASAIQLTGTITIIVVLVTIAFAVKSPTGIQSPGFTPSLWTTGTFSLLLSSFYMLTEMLPGWFRVAACLVLIIIFVIVIWRWSGRIGWSAMHRLALVAGAILTYAWLGIFMEPESGPKRLPETVGSLIFACAAISLAAFAAIKLQKFRRNTQTKQGDPHGASG